MKQTALITGAAKRIGKAISEFLAGQGWNIIIHYNSSSADAEALQKLLSQKYPKQRFHILQSNLSIIDEVLSLVPTAVKNYGNFQLLINNASVFDKSYLKVTTPELYDLQVNVNLKAPFFLIRDFANYCKKGNVINFVDTRVTSNKSNFAAYSLSKKGLWDLTQMAALELAPHIRVNAVAPGVTLAPEHEGELYLKKLAKNIPMKRPGGLQPILNSIEYILKNDFLTGQLLFSDGGENLGFQQ